VHGPAACLAAVMWPLTCHRAVGHRAIVFPRRVDQGFGLGPLVAWPISRNPPLHQLDELC